MKNKTKINIKNKITNMKRNKIMNMKKNKIMNKIRKNNHIRIIVQNSKTHASLNDF